MKRSTRHESPPPGVELDLVADFPRARPPVGLDAKARALALRIGSGGRHPVLVGPSEVGKSTLVRALAGLIMAGERPAGASAIWQVSLRTLASIAPKDVSLSEALGEIIKRASESRARPVVYVRDLWSLRRYELEHDLASALANTDVRFLGEAWPSFTAWTHESADLAAVTRVIKLAEPSREETLDLVSEVYPGFSPESLGRAVDHAAEVFAHRRSPGRDLDLLDAVTRERAARLGPTSSEKSPSPAELSEGVCLALGVPGLLLDRSRAAELGGARARITRSLVGQKAAVDAAMSRLSLRAAGLGDPQRPVGVMLLAGTAGVGKTRLAELLATEVFGSPERLVRVSMGEFSEDWKVDQLFGQRGASGVEGRRGVLSSKLSGAPYVVLLLDEVEKAHPMAWRHLLKPLDEGVCINGNEETFSLRNALVILTTNVGEEVFRESSVGFSASRASHEGRASVLRRLADAFPHELLDRMDHIVVCPPLDEEALRELCEREIEVGLKAAMAARKIVLSVDDGVIQRVVQDALGSRGVRALRRAIDRHLSGPLAEILTNPNICDGAHLRVSLGEPQGECEASLVPSPGASPAALPRSSRTVGAASRRAPKPLVAAVASARRDL